MEQESRKERKRFCRIFCFQKITLCQTRRTILHDESVSVINFLTRRRDSRFCGPLLSGFQLRWAVRSHRCVSEVSFYIFVRGASFTIGILAKCVMRIHLVTWTIVAKLPSIHHDCWDRSFHISVILLTIFCYRATLNSAMLCCVELSCKHHDVHLVLSSQEVGREERELLTRHHVPRIQNSSATSQEDDLGQSQGRRETCSVQWSDEDVKKSWKMRVRSSSSGSARARLTRILSSC